MNDHLDLWPKEIGNPARRALVSSGFTKLEQLTKLSKKELLAIHGVGPKATGILKQMLADKGLSFK
jgi:DNA-directed RNA polymerase alpha subunit